MPEKKLTKAQKEMQLWQEECTVGEFTGYIQISLSVGPEIESKKFGRNYLPSTSGPIWIKIPDIDLSLPREENDGYMIQESNNVWTLIENALKAKYTVEDICEH